MSLKIDTVMHACEQISNDISDLYKNLKIRFVIHHAGQLSDALVLVAQEIDGHPAANNALQIMKKRYKRERSGYMGTAVAEEHFFFGLATKQSLLSLCNINLNEFDNIRDARQFAHHLAWHAIDSQNYYEKNNKQALGRNEIILRKRNTLEIAGANLQADVFSSVVHYLSGETDALQYIARRRGIEALSTKSKYTPEFFPYIIAMEAAEAALKKFEKKHMNRRQILTAALKVAKEVGQVFEAVSVSKWIGFSKPAQEMAWRGHTKHEILSAAINTSRDTFVRSTAFLVSEVTDITPSDITDIQAIYSPFADEGYNEALHKKIISKTYEDMIITGIANNDIASLIELANKQNHNLTEGRTEGWCASAIQAAATAYEKALLNGAEPEIAAMREFEQECGRTSWAQLEELGENVIKENRRGGIVTMKRLAEICKEITDIDSIETSIQKTLRDTDYENQLEMASELDNVHAISGPALQAAPKMAAAPATPAAPVMGAPGLGGMGGRPSGMPAQQTQNKQSGRENDADSKQEQ